MGFYTQYFSTIFKGIRMTSFKEKREISGVINNLRRADHTLYKSLFEDVVERHKVTKAIKEEERLINELKKSAEKVYMLIYNISTEDLMLLKAVEDILKEFEAFSESAGTLSKSADTAQLKKVERDFTLAFVEALKKAEREEKEEYKQVMLVIDEAEEKDHNKFMANIRLAFQQETTQTILAKFAMRFEVRRIMIDILKLKQIPVKIKAIRRRLTEKAKKEGVEKIIRELYSTINEIKKYTADGFYELFLIKKRDILLVLKILLDLNNLRQFNEKWKSQRFMPEAPIKKKNEEIDGVELKLAKEFHIVAQAFRIIVAKTQKLEKEAEIDASKQ